MSGPLGVPDSRADGGRRPLRADARRNYERLLAEAAAVFAEQGVDASLEEVARRAGVGIGTLYRHFPSREALLEVLLRERFDHLRARAEELLRSGSPFEGLATWARAVIAGANTYRGLGQALIATLNDPESDLYASCHAMREAGAALLARARQAGEVRSDVPGPDLFLLVNAAAWAAEQMPDDPEVAERLLRVILDGVRPPGRS